MTAGRPSAKKKGKTIQQLMDRDNLVRLSVQVDPILMRDLKTKAARERTTIRELLTPIIEQLVRE